MKKLNYWMIVLAAVCLIPACSLQAREKKNKKSETEQTTGAQDREQWVKWLWKISYPVIHNLAEGTLHQNMPIETVNGNPAGYDEITHLEAVGRTLAGVAPWLALPDDDTEEGKLRKQMREEVLKGLKNAVDPNSPDKLNFTKQAQPIVDAAYLVHAFLRAPKALWEPLDKVTKQRYIDSFKALRDRTGAYNNWLLFTGLTEAFLMQQGERADQFRLRVSKNKIQEWYVGDGWYSDGSKFSMDYYNSYVLNPMMVAMMETLVPFRWASQKEYEQALSRMVRHAEFCERIIGPDGTYPAFGRSVTYRTAAFQSLADVALRGKLPSFIKPAQVRCALTAVHRNMYEGNQNFDKDGWLVLGFNGHQPEVADGYTSTGSLYMATLSFLPLGLPADNPFWTDEPADWTTKKAWKGEKIRKDYKVEY
ncbi:DUF2264 domain-containing protein [uncultured Mediterranea sp.]|uniref:DUF2264 domain-containing protein n=1 Tax=uncultured Mediterranea sp. TaxID=1926662 RepID=UPI0027D9C71E|nr:DUF2264 domain-containing protein [uncultured Mediterranea sp.]